MNLSRFAALLATTLAVAPATAQDQALAPLRLDLNIPTLKLVVYEGDRAIRTYDVAVGEPKFQTPTGEFEIRSAEWNPWWRPPAREWAAKDKITPPGPQNPMGRVKLFFTNLYYVHGTPDEKSIGSAASHGCVRMRNKDVIELGRLLHQRAAPSAVVDIDKTLAGRRTASASFRASVPLVIRYDPVVIDRGEMRIYPDLYGRQAAHTESVYQALLAAGYGVEEIGRDQIRTVLNRAAKHKGTFKIAVADAFGAAVLRGEVAAGAGR